MATIPELRNQYENLDTPLVIKDESEINAECLLTFQYEYPEQDTQVFGYRQVQHILFLPVQHMVLGLHHSQVPGRNDQRPPSGGGFPEVLQRRGDAVVLPRVLLPHDVVPEGAA